MEIEKAIRHDKGDKQESNPHLVETGSLSRYHSTT